MENIKEIVINIRVPALPFVMGRRGWMALLAFFFLCWHPGTIGSETLTLTTYYPAPYGGYVSLLTTNNTLLARDAGTVGIRTGTPDAGYVLHINGDTRWGGSMLNTDQGGSIELGQIGGGTPFIDFHFGGGGDYNTRLINDANGQLSLAGNLNMANAGAQIIGNNLSISGLCTWRAMGAGWATCAAGENLFNVNYTGLATEWACIGVAGNTCAAGTKTIGITGSMLCCRIN